MSDTSLTHSIPYSARWWLEHLLRLRLLIALAVAFGLAVPSLIIAHTQGQTVKEETFGQLRTDLQQLTDVSAEALRESLWQFYPELGDSIARAVFHDPRIRLLRVHDTRGDKPFLEYVRPLEKGESVLHLQRTIQYKNREIGSVEISMSTAQANERAQSAQRQILLRTVAGLALSLLLIFVVMHWQLVRPIEYLKRMSGQLADQKLDEPIRLPRHDELGQLAQSLEATRISLARSFAELEEKKQELQRHANGLERRVEARTHELAESNARLSQVVESLQRAQSELIEADRLASLGRMVAGIAHELNTPLGSSLAVMTTLLEHHNTIKIAIAQGGLRRSQLEDFIAGVGEGLNLMQLNVIRAADMVTKFRQVAVDQTSEQRRHFDLKHFIDEVQLPLSPRFNNEPIQLHTNVPEGLVLDSFPGPLGQVLANLELNALIHAFEGRNGGNIWIQAEYTAPGFVRISVRDDGIGMNQTVREHIFDPFFTTRLGRGGSGLGLSIVYNIVTGILGGHVTARSKPGEGSEFIVDIPLHAPERAEKKPPEDIGFG